VRVSARIAVNQITRWGATLAQGVIALSMVPLLIRFLGKDGYGVVSVLIAVVAMCAMADFGLRTALGRHLADELARGQHARFNELFSSAVSVALIAGSFAGLMWALLAPGLIAVFNLPASLAAEAQPVIRWYGAIAIPLSFLLTIYGAVIFASGRSDIVDGVGAGTATLQAVGLLTALGMLGGGLVAWALVSIGELSVRLLILRYFGRRLAPFGDTRLGLVRRDVIGRLFSTSVHPFMLQVMYAATIYADPLVLTTILGPSAVAIYRAGTALPMRIHSLFSIADQLQPFAVAYHVTDQKAKLQDVLIRGTRYTALLGILPCAILGVFSEPITRFWLSGALGSDYRAAGQVLVGWVIVELLTTAAGGAQWPIFLAVNKLRFLAWSQIPFAVLNLAVSIILVAWTSVGVLGVVIGTIVAALIRRPMLVSYAARACGLATRTYVAEAYARPAMVLVILVAVAVSWLRLGFAESIPGLLAGATATTCAWFLSVWWLGLTANDRRDVRVMLAESPAALAVLGGRRSGPLRRGE
jgi:O-antigen/teichoic acid export membrane protein